MRRLFLLVLCSGCDKVFLDPPDPPICGPYESITPVPFADFLMDQPRDFSVSYDPNVGMVFAKIQISASSTFTGPIPIRLDPADGLWKPDRTANINTLWKDATGGHMLGDGSVFVWRDRTNQPSAPPSLFRWVFTNGWTQSTTEGTIDNDVSRNYRPGNELVLPIDNGTLRFYPVVKTDPAGMEPTRIQVRQKFADDNWGDTAQATLLGERENLVPSSAVMTLDHKILVYAATIGGGKSRIFASVRDRSQDKFLLGVPLDLDSDDEDVTEPWIAEDCKTLYFRRGGITYRAQ